ncbi:MAG: hypothetical protein CME66_04875 [Halobacteriovoraceae bacterium]|jgi:hypothetical protein|nr:hypothetical protein [Halobacteriovoraceae bacterium]
MLYLQFIIVTSILISCFIYTTKTLQKVSCVNTATTKKIHHQLNKMVSPSRLRFSRCHHLSRTFISLKGNVDNE